MSKAFNKIWCDGLIYKLKKHGIFGDVLLSLKSLLSDRKQGVVLNDQRSNWQGIKAGPPQGSILGSLLFLIYIKDLAEGLKTRVKLLLTTPQFFPFVKDPTLNLPMNLLVT